MQKTIAIVETSAVSSAELNALCKEIIPDVLVTEIIDNSMIREVNANGGVTKGVGRRLLTYFANAQSLKVDLIVNQCSSVGEAADACAKFIDTPVMRIDRPMAKKAAEIGGKIAVIATVATTLGPSCRLIGQEAEKMGKVVDIIPSLVDGAMMLLIEKNDVAGHNKMVVGVVEEAARECDVIVLAQGSMTVLLPELEHIQKPVLSSLRSGIEAVKEFLAQTEK